nr:MAG TPA: Photosynthesis system II assembly factor YCF48 [Caudoviricetes sp.]
MKIQDIQISDKTLWQDFVTKYESGDYYGALAVLQNAQLTSKANTASVANAMIKAVDDLQDLYYTNVEDKLADGLATFQESIDNIANQGEYDATKQYAQGNFVLYNGNVYMYIANTPSTGNLPTDTAYWVNLGLKGDTGAPSLDLNLRYNWQSNLQYNLKDVVYYENGLYWAKQTSTGRKPSFEKQVWLYAAYGNGRFVLLSNDGKYAAYSTDGVNWGHVKMPLITSGGESDSTWNCLCFGNGLFVTSGWRSDKMAYSTDGIYWTQVTASNSGRWSDIAYGNGKFVVVGSGGSTALYSDDGISWEWTSTGATLGLNAVCYGNGKFVSAGPIYSQGFFYSEDGINWTKKTGGVWNQASVYQIIYGNGKFLMFSQRDNSGYCYTSTDGITWTYNNTIGITNKSQTQVVFANDKFYYVYGANSDYEYSEDAETWTKVDPYPFPNGGGNYKGFNNMVYGGGKYVATNAGGLEAMISDDALTWTETEVSNENYWGILIQNLPADITVSSSTPTKPYQGQLWWQVD